MGRVVVRLAADLRHHHQAHFQATQAQRKLRKEQQTQKSDAGEMLAGERPARSSPVPARDLIDEGCEALGVPGQVEQAAANDHGGQHQIEAHQCHGDTPRACDSV